VRPSHPTDAGSGGVPGQRILRRSSGNSGVGAGGGGSPFLGVRAALHPCLVTPLGCASRARARRVPHNSRGRWGGCPARGGWPGFPALGAGGWPSPASAWGAASLFFPCPGARWEDGLRGGAERTRSSFWGFVGAVGVVFGLLTLGTGAPGFLRGGWLNAARGCLWGGPFPRPLFRGAGGGGALLPPGLAVLLYVGAHHGGGGGSRAVGLCVLGAPGGRARTVRWGCPPGRLGGGFVGDWRGYWGGGGVP